MNKEMILMLSIAGIIIILGIGTIVYVCRSLIRKMKAEFNETGFYPYGYFYMLGYLYSIPIACIIGYFCLPLWDVYGKWANLMFAIPVVLPGSIWGKILENKNKDKTRPRSVEEKKAGNRFTYFAIGLMVLFVLYKVFVQKGN